jgi:hypothetical protein
VGIGVVWKAALFLEAKKVSENELLWGILLGLRIGGGAP